MPPSLHSMYGFERNFRRLQRQLAAGAIALAGVFVLGMAWYRWIEGWTWIESAYMTAITLSTVGFSEVRPLSPRTRLFAIALIFLGVLSIGYIVNRFTEALIQGYWQQSIQLRQQRRLMNSLDAHYIVCGYGRMGRSVALEFAAEGVPFVITDIDPDRIEAARQEGFLAVLGDATQDETLQAVGIERAVCLVASLSSDAENLYTVLSARALNGDIRAIARASSEEAAQKLQRAGADAAISPYITGARRLAAAALRPQVMDFVDGILTGTNRSLYIEEVQIEPGICPFVGQTLAQAELRPRSGALILAIRRDDGRLVGGPRSDEVLLAGDLLFCMGTPQELRRLNRLVAPTHPETPRLPKS